MELKKGNVKKMLADESRKMQVFKKMNDIFYSRTMEDPRLYAGYRNSSCGTGSFEAFVLAKIADGFNLSIIAHGAKDLRRLVASFSLGDKKKEKQFDATKEGYDNACRWLDGQRVLFAETMLNGDSTFFDEYE